MYRRITFAACAALLVLFACARPAAAQAAAEPTEQEIKDLIVQLGSDDFNKREEAQARLTEIGEAAEPFLQQALSNPDPEIRVRAADILKRMKWRLPASVKNILDADTVLKLETFPEQSQQEQYRLLSLLVQRAPRESVPFCIKVLTNLDNDNLLSIASQNIRKNALAGDIPALKRLVEIRRHYIIILTLAELLERDGKTAEAVDAYEQALAVRPNDPGITGKLALLYEKGEMWDKSAKLYSSLLTAQPSNISWLERLGNALWKQGKKDEAVAAWSDIVQKNQKSEMAYFRLVDIFIQNKMPDRALAVLDEGQKIFPSYRFPLRIGVIMAEAGDKEAALRSFNRARSLATRSYELRAAHAEILNILRTDDERRKLLDETKAAAEKNNDPRQTAIEYYLAADLARKLKLVDQMIQFREKVQSLSSQLPEGTLELDENADDLIHLYKNYKKWDKAIALCSEVLKQRGDPYAIEVLGEALWQKDEKEKALQTWKRLVTDEQASEYRMGQRYVSILLEHELYKEALAAVIDLAQSGEYDEERLLLLRGMAYLGLKDLPSAMTAFDQLLRSENANDYLRQEIVDELKNAGLLAEAEKLLRPTVEKEALKLAEQYLKAGKDLEAAGKSAEAADFYKKVIAAAPNSDFAKEAAERLKKLGG